MTFAICLRLERFKHTKRFIDFCSQNIIDIDGSVAESILNLLFGSKDDISSWKNI